MSPAATFGAWNPGEHTGGSDVSGADLAHAIVDEIERPAHRRARFGVAY